MISFLNSYKYRFFSLYEDSSDGKTAVSLGKEWLDLGLARDLDQMTWDLFEAGLKDLRQMSARECYNIDLIGISCLLSIQIIYDIEKQLLSSLSFSSYYS